MAQLPQEILEQILMRLGVRDLIRCKSVTKSWLSLISDPHFIKAHLERSYHHDRNNDEIGHRRLVISRVAGSYRHYVYEADDMDFDYTDCHLLGSSNGLVCVSPSRTEILVVNPETREVSKLRKPEFPEIGLLCWGFGYDSSTDDYKVVLGFRKGEDFTCFQMLTLKSNIWKVIGEVNYACTSRIGIVCNGALHWVANRTSPEDKDKVILSFDLSEEKFKEIPQPDDVRYEAHVASHSTMRLGSMEDCLCVFRHEMLPHNLWIMKNYNVKQSWRIVGHEQEIKLEAVHLLKELKHYIPNRRSLCYNMWFCESLEFVGAPIYVQSLVSPHVCRRPKRKRQTMGKMRSGKVTQKAGKVSKGDISGCGSDHRK